MASSNINIVVSQPYTTHKSHLTINQNTNYTVNLIFTDNNGDAILMTNFIVNASFKKWYTSTNTIIFSTSINYNIISLSLNPGQTANIYPGRYVYDVLISNNSSNTQSRVVEGILTLTPAVTGIVNVYVSPPNYE